MRKRIEKYLTDGEKIRVHAKRMSGINGMEMTKSTSMAVGVIHVGEHRRSNTDTKGQQGTPGNSHREQRGLEIQEN